MCICCVAGEIVDPLTETMAPEVANSTHFAPEEVSSAGPASPATTEMVAVVDSEMSTALHLPNALPLGDEQAPHSHSPTSTPWRKGLVPHMGYGRSNSPTATGVTNSEKLGRSAEQRVDISPSQPSSMAEAYPCAPQRVTALTNVPTGTTGQEQLNLPLLEFSDQTTSATTSSQTAFGVPQTSSQDGPGTALPVTGEAALPTLNTTLGAHVEMGREDSSWSEKYSGALGSSALPGTSPAPSLMPSPVMNTSECAFGVDRHMWQFGCIKPHSESGKMQS